MFRKRKKGYTLEDKIQHSFVQTLRLSLKKATVYHINNSGKTDSERMRHAYLGVLPGVPDLHIIWPNGHGYIEVKTPKGKQSKVQKEFQKLCKKYDIPYAVCRTLEDVKTFLEINGIPHKPFTPL